MLRKTLLSLAIAPLAAFAADLPIFDAHLHYSHDAWESVPPAQAIADLTAFLETLSDRGGRYQRQPFPEDCR